MAQSIALEALFDTLNHIDWSASPSSKSLPHPYGELDFKIVRSFLKQYDGNQSTFNSYRREVERFLHWSWKIAQRSILNLKRDDIENYIRFCTCPPKAWIGLKKVARFKLKDGARTPNPEWRPFVATVTKAAFKKGETPNKADYRPSQKAVQEIFVALGSFYNHLVSENIVELNPVATIRQKSKFIRKTQSTKKVLRLSEAQWQAVLNAASTMAEASPEKHARTKFVVSALYYMYLRISELAASKRWSPMMNHFYQDTFGHWWFTTVGKGNKQREIAVRDKMLDELKTWRKHLQCFPLLPTPDDSSPLLPKLKGYGNVASTDTIADIVQSCFDHAIAALDKQGDRQEANALRNASAHWLRHTGISDDINKHHRPVAHVRDDAGHASITTTDRYNDITLQDRHDSARET
jgi:site-specific recombinase XerD